MAAVTGATLPVAAFPAEGGRLNGYSRLREGISSGGARLLFDQLGCLLLGHAPDERPVVLLEQADLAVG